MAIRSRVVPPIPPISPAAAATIYPMVLPVLGEHQIAEARRSAALMLQSLGFRPPVSNYVVTAVSELAANLVFHARRGQLLTLRPVVLGARVGIEICSEDKGPGIADIPAAMRDGFSSNGGLGAGLPGVKRLMDDFEIESTVGAGTRIIARKWLP